jgi:dephospho-CoA kinase
MLPNNDRPLLIVITGGIASGKSLVSDWFEKKGYRLIYADRIGHECLKNERVKTEIRRKIGDDVFDNDEVSRKKLAQQVFSSKEKLAQLNAIIHPQIRKKMSEIVRTSREKILIFEIPLLFENSIETCFDYVISVSAEKKVQLKRLLRRDKIDEDEALKRINSQLPDEYKREKADFVIENNGSIDDCIHQLSELESRFDKLTKKQIESLENKKFSKRVY